MLTQRNFSKHKRAFIFIIIIIDILFCHYVTLLCYLYFVQSPSFILKLSDSVLIQYTQSIAAKIILWSIFQHKIIEIKKIHITMLRIPIENSNSKEALVIGQLFLTTWQSVVPLYNLLMTRDPRDEVSKAYPQVLPNEARYECTW